MVKTTTASTLSAIGVLIVGLCAAVSLLPSGTDAKRHGPLLVEDEGARRNRPAGKFEYLKFELLRFYRRNTFRVNFEHLGLQSLLSRFGILKFQDIYQLKSIILSKNKSAAILSPVQSF